MRTFISLRNCLGLNEPVRTYQAQDYINPSGQNTYQNPLQTDFQLIHAVNVFSPGIGIMAKRPGYGTVIGTVNGQVNTIFSHQLFGTAGTNLYVYAYAGSVLNTSLNGTGAWSIPAGGTFANNAHLGWCSFNSVLSVGDGVGTLATTGSGTSFTNPGSAPVGQYFSVYHNRVYVTDGTSSNVNYSVTNDPTNWQNSGTSDSSFLVVPNDGACAGVFTAGDRLIITQTRGNAFSWDDTSLIDMSSKYFPSSPWSIASIDDTWYYLNQYGIFSFDGASKQLISNPIQNYFYNQKNTGITSANFGTAPATTHYWDYLVAVGTVTDPFVGRQINNAIIKYDFQKSQFLTWSFANAPTALHSYVDINKKKQLLFGDASGNIYQLDLTKTSDNGAAIPTEMIFLCNYSSQQSAFSQTSASTVSGSNWEKRWKWFRAILTPGCEINVQWAFSNSLDINRLKWSETINTGVGDGDYWQFSDGVLEIRFPNNQNNLPRSRFLFVRFYESSDNSQWRYHGAQVDAEIQIIQ